MQEIHIKIKKIHKKNDKNIIFLSRDCGELPLPGYCCCDLGSINISNFIEGGKLNISEYKKTIELAVRFLDDVLDVNEYPMDIIRFNATSDRRIGLGIMGLHYAMLKCGIKYSSDEAITFTEQIYEILRNHSYWSSAQLAEEKGAFSKFDKEKFLAAPFVKKLPSKIRNEIRNKGIRNVALNTQAPTGTSSILANVSSGIEPIFASVHERRYRSGDEIKTEIVADDLFVQFMDEGKNIDHFESSHEISPECHLKIQDAAQGFLDNSISKTINIPNDYPLDELGDLLLKYLPNLKGVTIYRDGSRGDSPLKPLDPKVYFQNRNKEADDISKKGKCASGIWEI